MARVFRQSPRLLSTKGRNAMGDTRPVPHLLQPAQLNKLLSGLNVEPSTESVHCTDDNVLLETEPQCVLEAPDVFPGYSIRLLGKRGVREEFIRNSSATAGTETEPIFHADSSETEGYRNLWTPANQERRHDPGSIHNVASQLNHSDGLEIPAQDIPQHTHSLRLLQNRPAFASLHPHLQRECLPQVNDHRRTLSGMKPPEHVTSSAIFLRESKLHKRFSTPRGQLSSSCDPQQILKSARAYVGIPENSVVSFGEEGINLPPSDDNEDGAMTKSNSICPAQHQPEINQKDIGECERSCGNECGNGAPILADLTNVLGDAAEAVVCELRKIRSALERKASPQTSTGNKPSTTEISCHVNQGTTRAEACYNKHVAARLLTRLGHRTTLVTKDPPQKGFVRSPTPLSCKKVDALTSSETAAAGGSEDSTGTSSSGTFALPCPPIHMDPLPPSFLQERSKWLTQSHERASISMPETEQQDMRSFDDFRQKHIEEKVAVESKSPVEAKAPSQTKSSSQASSHPIASIRNEPASDVHCEEVASRTLSSSRSVSESTLVEEKPGEGEALESSAGDALVACELSENVENESTLSSEVMGNTHSKGSQSNNIDSMTVTTQPPEKNELSSEQVTSNLIVPNDQIPQGAAPEVEKGEPVSTAAPSLNRKPEQSDRLGDDGIALELAELILKVTGSKEVPPAAVARELGCSLERHGKEKSFLYVEDLTAVPGEIESSRQFDGEEHRLTEMASSLKKDRVRVSDEASSSSGRNSIDVDPGAFVSGHVMIRNEVSRKDAGCQADCKDNSGARRTSELSRICAKRANAARKAMRNAELNDLMNHIDEVRDLANEIEDDMIQTHGAMKTLERQRREVYRQSLLRLKERKRS